MPAPDHRPASPLQALDELLTGNRRFVTGAPEHPNQDAAHRAQVALAQQPFAVVFGCSDSRLAAEIIFDRGLGDLFVVRTAGQVVGPEVLSSIEYGVAVLGVPLLVVLGHDSCGAVQAAREAAATGQPPSAGLRAIVDGVAPSVAAAADRGVTDQAGVSRVHIRRTVDAITRPGTTIGDAVAAGRCAAVGMYYRLADGPVEVVCGAPAGFAVPSPQAAGPEEAQASPVAGRS